MIVNIVTTQILYSILSAVTQTGRIIAAEQPFEAYSSVEGWLTGFAMAALIISLILVFFLSANHQRSMHEFKSKIAGLKEHIDELRQEIDELSQGKAAGLNSHMSSKENQELVAIQGS